LPWQYATTCDLNNDLNTDVVLRDVSYGQNGVWVMNGTIYISSTLLPDMADTTWSLVGANHFNTSVDSCIDLVWQKQDGVQYAGTTYIWTMNCLNPPAILDRIYVGTQTANASWLISG